MSETTSNAAVEMVSTFLSAEEKAVKLEARRTRRLVRTGYTVEKAAVLLGIRPKQVRRNIRRGHLLAVKVGTRYYIAKAYFNAFQKARAS